jgi:hypothetical protein
MEENSPLAELKLPEFLKLQDFVNPFIKIQLLLASDRVEGSQNVQENASQLTFSKTSEQIIWDFETFFDLLVNSMNDVSRPEFCKIKVVTKKIYDRDQADKLEVLKS